MAQDISSRAARPGEPIGLTPAEDLKVGDAIVAKAGARALGEVVQGKRPDFWGEAGEVSMRVHFLRVGDHKVEIRGALGSAGTRYVVIRGRPSHHQSRNTSEGVRSCGRGSGTITKAAEASK